METRKLADARGQGERDRQVSGSAHRATLDRLPERMHNLDAHPSAMRCLIVDDEAALRGMLRRVSERDGFACTEARSGAEAVA